MTFVGYFCGSIKAKILVFDELMCDRRRRDHLDVAKCRSCKLDILKNNYKFRKLCNIIEIEHFIVIVFGESYTVLVRR